MSKTAKKYHRAVRDALACEMRRDDSVFLMGEDIAGPGGIYGQTQGLLEEFGPRRVKDTPAGEVGYMGAAVGAAINGLRPVAEISFADFFPVCLDPLVNHAAKIHYMSGSQQKVPLTVLSFGGGGLNAGPQHSGTWEATLGSVPGMKVLVPSGPRDVEGSIKAAIRDDNPTIVLMHKGLVRLKEEIEDDPEWCLPIGKANVRREGSDVTVVAWAGALFKALDAAKQLEADGVSVEVIDLASVQPLDIETILTSIKKTHRVVVAHETIQFAGVGAEIAAQLASSQGFDWLDAPIERVAHPFVPVPFAKPLEDTLMPQVDDVIAGVRKVMQ